MSRQALGRGLRALIPQGQEVDRGEVENIEVERIEANPYQPRKTFDRGRLQELADSIAQHGVLEPIILRRIDGGFQIVVGERRWRAAQLAGKKAIPAVIRDLSDRQMMEVALIENLQREDLNAIEEAEGYRRLIDEFALTQEEVASSVGKKRSSVANALRLLALDDQVKEMIVQGQISQGHAKVLLSVDDVGRRQQLAERVVEEQLSVRQLEKLVKEQPRVPRRTLRERSPELASIEEDLQRVLGTKVRVDYKKGKGRIEIEYYSDDEFERLVEYLAGSNG